MTAPDLLNVHLNLLSLCVSKKRELNLFFLNSQEVKTVLSKTEIILNSYLKLLHCQVTVKEKQSLQTTCNTAAVLLLIVVNAETTLMLHEVLSCFLLLDNSTELSS